MNIRRALLTTLAAVCMLPLLMGNSDCSGKPQTSSSGATQTTASTVPKNSKGNTVEQQNIDDKNRVTQDPTKVMWIHLIALDGKIIKRMPVRNKVTSSGKRLEPKQAAPAQSGYPSAHVGGHSTVELIQADGTYGDSDPYIYWFDPMGRYHQWGTAGGLGYLKTDYPIDLENPSDKITGLYNAHAAAAAWQKEQEAILKQREGKK